MLPFRLRTASPGGLRVAGNGLEGAGVQVGPTALQLRQPHDERRWTLQRPSVGAARSRCLAADRAGEWERTPAAVGAGARRGEGAAGQCARALRRIEESRRVTEEVPAAGVRIAVVKYDGSTTSGRREDTRSRGESGRRESDFCELDLPAMGKSASVRSPPAQADVVFTANNNHTGDVRGCGRRRQYTARSDVATGSPATRLADGKKNPRELRTST